MITNDDINPAHIQLEGYYVTGTTNTPYILEIFNLVAGEVATSTYYAQFNAFEFQFITSSDAVQISVWGKNALRIMSAAHRLVAEELNPISMQVL